MPRPRRRFVTTVSTLAVLTAIVMFLGNMRVILPAVGSASNEAIRNLEARNEELEAKNQDLLYRLSMLEARVQLPILGPRLLQNLPAEVYNRFSEHDMEMRLPETFARYAVSKTQVAEAAWPYMEYDSTSGWKPVWSQELIDALVAIGKNNGDFSCADYPKSVLQLYKAMERVQSIEKGKKLRILVVGAISPWVEAVVLSRPGIQIDRLVTTDYNPIDIKSSQLAFVHMEDLKRNRPDPLFDVVISYSSIEHDGLGRYGDPINPEGDFAAVKEYSLMLKQGGFLLLGIPVALSENGKGWIQRNVHRIYSRIRLEKLTEAYTRVGDPITVPEIKKDWKYQPVYVLRKN